MVDVTSAVIAANEYFQNLKSSLGHEPPENLRLEEVRKTDDEKRWLITLGYDARVATARIPNIFSERSETQSEYDYVREYKQFQINRETGEVESMEIRKV